MRILMLVAHPSIQGPLPKHTPHLIAGLEALGCQVESRPWSRHHERERLPEKLVGRTRDLLEVRRTLRQRTFDVMVVKTSHDRATLTRDIALLFATRGRCRRAVLQFHGSQSSRLLQPGSRLFKFASALMLRLADAALVLSTEELGEWQRFSSRGKFYVVKNPLLGASDARPQVKPERAEPTILFVGRLIPEKGVFDLIDAVAAVFARMPCRLMVVGDGPYATQLAEHAQTLGLEGRSSFRGYLNGEALSAAYREADVLALPTYWDEGFPTVLGEAMAAGLPIVTTRSRGAADYLREREHALFVPAQDPPALAAALLELLGDSALRSRMGRANRQRVKIFSTDVVAREYLSVLQEVAGPGLNAVGA
jgi:glycosyltransferase involved in cell wall biosynthesis